MANGSSIALGYWLTGEIASAAGSYGPLVSQSQDASGRVLNQGFGDAAGTIAGISYDNNGWMVAYGVERSSTRFPPASGGYVPPAPSDYTSQTALTLLTIAYDKVGDPISVTQRMGDGDGTVVPSEWPVGALPMSSRRMTYSDAYRLLTYQTVYAGGDDSAVVDGNPYTDTERGSGLYPAPSVPSTGNRVRSEGFVYDFQGNVTSSSDDANDLWDRSLGQVTYNAGTDQIAMMANGGTVTYDSGGNVSAITSGTGESFAFGFDEMGRLTAATRSDANGTVNELYTYDAQGERVTINKEASSSGGGSASYNVFVFDSLELKNAAFPDANGDYEHDDTTEQVYLRAGSQMLGRAFVDQTGMPTVNGSPLHVFLTIADPIGSTAFVVDQGTSELVEATTYQPYGGIDSDYRPARWNSPREDVKYTGQWDNAEVGLVYMHARYYSPQLGRFISPDPVAVQTAKGDPNPYAYALGSPFRFTDPTGLYDQYSPCAFGEAECNDSYQPINIPDQASTNNNGQSNQSQYGVSNVGNTADFSGIIPVSFVQAFPPHGGALLYDQTQTDWTESFPSGSTWDSPSVVHYESNVGNIVSGADGLPTTASLQSVMQVVFTNQGRASSLLGVILPGLNVDAARQYAQSAKQNPPRYNFLGLLSGSENCASFVCNEITAAGGESPNTVIPDDLIVNNAAFLTYFMYSPATGLQYQPPPERILPISPTGY